MLVIALSVILKNLIDNDLLKIIIRKPSEQ